jgi:transcription elongation factor Elf1
MVHYDPPMSVAQIPPPVCPKCGSHRTVIVGRSGTGTIVLRCNACGARSEITVDDQYGAPYGANEDEMATDLQSHEGDNHAA